MCFRTNPGFYIVGMGKCKVHFVIFSVRRTKGFSYCICGYMKNTSLRYGRYEESLYEEGVIVRNAAGKLEEVLFRWKAGELVVKLDIAL